MKSVETPQLLSISSLFVINILTRLYIYFLEILFCQCIFRSLIMNIDCDMMLRNLDNSSDDYNSHVTKIMILQVIRTQADLDKMVDEFISHKTKFNTAHIIKSDIQQIMNIPEKARFISSMAPTGFRNDQDKSRCYVNSTFQVLFFNVFFRSLIMNV